MARSLVGCQLRHNIIDYRVTAQLYGSPDNLKWFRLSASNAFGNASDIVLGRSFVLLQALYLPNNREKSGRFLFYAHRSRSRTRCSDKLR